MCNKISLIDGCQIISVVPVDNYVGLCILSQIQSHVISTFHSFPTLITAILLDVSF